MSDSYPSSSVLFEKLRAAEWSQPKIDAVKELAGEPAELKYLVYRPRYKDVSLLVMTRSAWLSPAAVVKTKQGYRNGGYEIYLVS